MSVNLEQQLLSKPAEQLLEEFGAGNPAPGAGSAAALMGMLACQLCRTVIQLTKKYNSTFPEGDKIESCIRPLEIRLREAFQEDSDEFDKYIEMIRERNQEAEGTRKYDELADQARMQLRHVTRIPLEICEMCLEVCGYAIDLLESGRKAVRGDTGSAAYCALSGATATLFTSYLNLKILAVDSSDELSKKCDELLEQAESLQKRLSIQLTKLRDEWIESSNKKATRLKVVKARQPISQPALPGFSQERINLAAKTTLVRDAEEVIKQTEQTHNILESPVLSDEEVFAEVLDKYAKGKNKDAWFAFIHDFFAEQGLGTFAHNVDFLYYLKNILYAKRLKSPKTLRTSDLLKMYIKYKEQENWEGTRL